MAVSLIVLTAPLGATKPRELAEPDSAHPTGPAGSSIVLGDHMVGWVTM
jgi:hypothetical protein